MGGGPQGPCGQVHGWVILESHCALSRHLLDPPVLAVMGG